MFAVFESGGKQHRATEGEVVRLERLQGEPGDHVVFDRVLMIAEATTSPSARRSSKAAKWLAKWSNRAKAARSR